MKAITVDADDLPNVLRWMQQRFEREFVFTGPPAIQVTADEDTFRVWVPRWLYKQITKQEQRVTVRQSILAAAAIDALDRGEAPNDADDV